MDKGFKENMGTEVVKSDKLLEQFVDIEYGMISYITILNELEELYDQKDKEDLRKLTIATITQLTSLQENLSRVISELETHMLQVK